MEIISQLNRNLRLACDGRQWILQAARGRPTAKNTGWRSFKFLTSRRGLENALKSELHDRYQGSIEVWVEGLPEILPSRSAIEWSASFRRPTGLPIQPEPENEAADAFLEASEPLQRAG
jgi:hypothetical protein